MRLSLRALILSVLVLSLSLVCGPQAFAQSGAGGHPLFGDPTISETMIAFHYADDIWLVPRAGGVARRLTSTGTLTDGPYFSPDGQTLAYSARTASGDTDIFTLPVTGGVAHRVTYHPGGNYIAGWTPDGRDLLYGSMQSSVRTYFQLFKIHADGSGLPERLPLPSAFEGSYSPDGSHLAYNPWLQWQAESWKRYRGGQTQPVWVVDLKTLELTKVPRENSNDTHPVWLGDSIYFLSDRNGPVTLFGYNTKTHEVKQLVENHGLDFKALSGRGDTLVYEQFGTIHLYDIATGQQHEVSITADGDLPALQPHVVTFPTEQVQNVALSPTGVRAVFEVHGEIFTVPAEKGDVRDITQTSNAAEREPSWSPDGKRIAYFSDASGEYQLYLRDQDGLKPPTVIPLTDQTYDYAPVWSPDSKRILFSDKRLHLWYVNVDPALGPARPVLVTTALLEGFGPSNFSASWSPDAKWILYSTALPSFEDAAFLYNLADGKNTQITDGMSDVSNPAFDPSGKYLYFTASTDDGPGRDGFGLGSLNRTASASVYVAVLSKYGLSPIPPQSDDEKSKEEADKKGDEPTPAPTDAAASEEKKDGKGTDKTGDKGDKKDDKKDEAKDKTPETKIDLEGMGQRILALPIPARNYVSLSVAKTGVLLLGEGPAASNPADFGGPMIRSVWKFTLESRKTEDVLNNVNTVLTSFDGKKVLYNREDNFWIADVDELKAGAADGTPGHHLNTTFQAMVDPRAEWQQMYNETWRIEREFFYDPGFHGLDLAKIKAKYEPWVGSLSCRGDLTYLQEEMLGEITVGHMFISGPRTRAEHPAPKTGLLGADYRIVGGRYQIAHIVQGGNWDPSLYSPLTQPGVNVHEGEFIVAVNGKPLTAEQNVYSAFAGLAGQQTTITVAYKADGTGSREVLVVPVASERDARMQEWVDGNVRRTDELSHGEVAYVYLPNTGGPGFDSFNRYFFAQTNKHAVIVDDRWNEGGDIADYVIDVLKRVPMINYESRQGMHVTEPTGAIFGPKAMLINQNAGSGGDAMPWLFREAGLGPLVGTRTWGGLVGIGGYPVLLDGGTVTAPRTALYNLNGQFDIENKGVPPDVEVQDDPKAVAAGHDPQLEKAVQILMDDLKAHPPVTYPAPPYPNYHQLDGLGH